MNHRYIRIIVTCIIVGSITLAFKQNNMGNIPADKLTTIKTSMETDASPITATSTTKHVPARRITIKPDISSDDLKVHKFGTHSPKSISLTINDEEIEINNNDPITVKVDGSLTVTTRCKYAFVMNHKGENVSTWKIKPGKEYAVKFDWDVPAKITLEGDGATLVETHKLTPEELKESNARNTHKKKARK